MRMVQLDTANKYDGCEGGLECNDLIDPFGEGRDPCIDTRLVWQSASNAPRYDSHERPSTIVLNH